VHAVLRWTGRDWELRDLNSTNGTYLEGRRLAEASSRPVAVGARIGFGQPADQWEFIDGGYPEAMAVPLDGGDPVALDGEIIALPSRNEPQATIYKTRDGGWVLEHGDNARVRLSDAATFQVAGRPWRFCCFETAPPTIGPRGRGPVPVEFGALDLSFAVSRDEEHVELIARCGDRTFDLGARAAHYLLLTLARRRLDDARAGFADTSCGWVDLDELSRDPSMCAPRLNVDVHRVRDKLGRLGIVDAAKIVERRSGSRQIRIGTGRIAIRTL
jgi:hypothetical protein